VFTTEIKVGRLYEHRMFTLESEEELTQLAARGKEVMASMSGKVVVCADYRNVAFMRADLTARYVQFLSAVSPKVERSAILIRDDHAIFGLQIARMVREANFPSRRVFKIAEELKSWLGEILTPIERVRLSDFLAEPVEPPQR
jgi:hypothetical protein